jgi:hypothetical protein
VCLIGLYKKLIDHKHNKKIEKKGDATLF